MNTSLIISVYKNIQDLEVVLRSLELQTNKNFKVVISEDGECKKMANFITNWKSNIPISHFSQKDSGWQKNKALNQAIKKTDSDYLIFIDGDCVLHPKFIESHVNMAETTSVLAGRRVKLGQKFSKKLRSSNINSFAKQFNSNLIPIFLDKQASFADEGVYSPFIAKFRKSHSIKGCNFSCHKASLEKINGFDENYIRPAVGEDTDLDWRFEGVGIKIKSVRHLAIQYHLFHKESWTDASENIAYMNQQKAKEAFIAKNGLNKY